MQRCRPISGIRYYTASHITTRFCTSKVVLKEFANASNSVQCRKQEREAQKKEVPIRTMVGRKLFVRLYSFVLWIGLSECRKRNMKVCSLRGESLFKRAGRILATETGNRVRRPTTTYPLSEPVEGQVVSSESRAT